MQVLIDVTKFFCLNCGKFFNERVSKPYYTYEKFIDNQARLVFSDKKDGRRDYKYKKDEPTHMVNCPFCFSNQTLNRGGAMNLLGSGGCHSGLMHKMPKHPFLELWSTLTRKEKNHLKETFKY